MELYRDIVRQRTISSGQPVWDGLLSGVDLREGFPPADHKVLVATVGGGYLVGTQMESLLAIALRLRGAEVHVLLCDGVMPACQECTISWYPDEKRFAERGPSTRHCNVCFQPAREVYGSLGLVVHRYSDLITTVEVEEANRTARQLSIAEIPSYVVDGVHVGDHANAGALRFFARGTLDDSPEAEAILRRYFEAALLTHSATDRLLREFDFDVAVFHHGIYVPQGIVGDTARRRDVRVVNWNVAYRKNCFLFSHGDTYHHTLLSEPTCEWESMPWSDAMDAELTDYLRSRWSGVNDWISFHRDPMTSGETLAAETGVDLSKPCIGMLTNVIWDAQLHYQANAFPSMLDWAATTISYFADRPDLELLIRVHPAEVSGVMPSRQPFVEVIAGMFPAIPGNVHIIPAESKISTYAAMERCNAVLVFGTKTGVELSATGIPVIVAGEAWVRNKGITLDADSREAYQRLLDDLPLPGPLAPEIVARARKYAYHFFFRRMIPLEFAEQILGSKGFRWKLGTLADLAPGASRGLDVICDGILEGKAFVYPAEELSALSPVNGP